MHTNKCKSCKTHIDCKRKSLNGVLTKTCLYKIYNIHRNIHNIVLLYSRETRRFQRHYIIIIFFSDYIIIATMQCTAYRRFLKKKRNIITVKNDQVSKYILPTYIIIK